MTTNALSVEVVCRSRTALRRLGINQGEGGSDMRLHQCLSALRLAGDDGFGETLVALHEIGRAFERRHHQAAVAIGLVVEPRAGDDETRRAATTDERGVELLVQSVEGWLTLAEALAVKGNVMFEPVQRRDNCAFPGAVAGCDAETHRLARGGGHRSWLGAGAGQSRQTRRQTGRPAVEQPRRRRLEAVRALGGAHRRQARESRRSNGPDRLQRRQPDHLGAAFGHRSRARHAADLAHRRQRRIEEQAQRFRRRLPLPSEAMRA
jgi:hypothetical protein